MTDPSCCRLGPNAANRNDPTRFGIRRQVNPEGDRHGADHPRAVLLTYSARLIPESGARAAGAPAAMRRLRGRVTVAALPGGDAARGHVSLARSRLASAIPLVACLLTPR